MSARTSMRAGPSSSTRPTVSSFLAMATSSSAPSRMARSVSGMLVMSPEPPWEPSLYRMRALDLQHRRRLALELHGGVVDAEAGVEQRVQLGEQALAVAHVLHDHVRAHRLAAGGQRPHVQVVDAA